MTNGCHASLSQGLLGLDAGATWCSSANPDARADVKLHPTQRATQVLQALQQRWLSGVPDVEIPKPPQAVSLVGHHGCKGLDWVQRLSVLVADHTSMTFRRSAHMLYIAVECLTTVIVGFGMPT